MAVLPILRWPDARLATACDPVGEITDEIRTLAADMLVTMYDAPGRGLAAPQVGRLIRLFVMDAHWKEAERAPVVMIDPEILGASDEAVAMDEGCLSIPGITTSIMRPVAIRVGWTDLEGMRQVADLTGVAARVVQHEYDHLDGLVTFDRLDEAARASAIVEYAG